MVLCSRANIPKKKETHSIILGARCIARNLLCKNLIVCTTTNVPKNGAI